MPATKRDLDRRLVGLVTLTAPALKLRRDRPRLYDDAHVNWFHQIMRPGPRFWHESMGKASIAVESEPDPRSLPWGAQISDHFNGC
jgi:hypothetical protein